MTKYALILAANPDPENKRIIEDTLSISIGYRLEIRYLEGNFSANNLRFTIKELFEKSDEPLVFHFSGYGCSTSGKQLFFSAENKNQFNQDVSLSLDWLDKLAQQYIVPGIVVLDCCHSSAWDERHVEQLNEIVDACSIPVSLLSTSICGGEYRKRVLAQNSKVTDLYKRYVSIYLERYLPNARKSYSLSDVGISILEGLSMASLSNKEMVFEYYHLSVRSDLSEIEEDRMNEILTLAEKDYNFSKIISKVDELVCQKSGIKVPKDDCIAQIKSAVNRINMKLYASELPSIEDEDLGMGMKKLPMPRPQIENLLSSAMQQMESWKIGFELWEVEDERELLDDLLEKAISSASNGHKQLAEKFYSLASEYYHLSIQSELSELEEERLDEVLSLAEEDNDFAKVIGRVDELVCGKLEIIVSDDACNMQVKRAVELISAGFAEDSDEDQDYDIQEALRQLEEMKISISSEYSLSNLHFAMEFVGRQDLYEQCQSLLKGSRSVFEESIPIVIRGAAGAGKTALLWRLLPRIQNNLGALDCGAIGGLQLFFNERYKKLNSSWLSVKSVEVIPDEKTSCEMLTRAEYYLDVAREQRYGAIGERKPQMVYLSTDSCEAELFSRGSLGKTQVETLAAIANLYSSFAGVHQVEFVNLNACHSQIQAHDISKHIPWVAMRHSVGNHAELEFSVVFYDSLESKGPIYFALELRKVDIASDIEDHLENRILSFGDAITEHRECEYDTDIVGSQRGINSGITNTAYSSSVGLQEELLTSAFQEFSSGILIISGDGAVLYHNQQAINMLSTMECSSRYNGIPESIWRLCKHLSSMLETLSPEKVIAEEEIKTSSEAILRMRVQLFTMPRNIDVPHFLITLEDLQGVAKRTALSDAFRYKLTPRETDVWALQRANYSYQEIAEKLHISISTVRKYLRRITAKRKWTTD